MCKKIFISFLLVALFNLLVGCYSSELVTVPEYNQIEEVDKPKDIRVITKDGQEFHFSDSNFSVKDDTLYGKGKLLLEEKEEILNREIALSNIEAIEFEYVSWLNRIFRGVVFFGILGIIFLLVVTLTYPG